MAELTLRTLTRAGDTTKNAPLTNAEIDTNFINLDQDISTKQNTLVSGTNIKTINGQSILGPGNLSSGIEFTVISTPTTLVDKQGVIVSTGAGPFTVSLPANPTNGTHVVIVDGADWGANNLTVDPQGKIIENQTAGQTFILNTKGLAVQFLYNGARWKMYASAYGIVTGEFLSKSGGTMTGSLNWATPVSIASAATTNIGAAASNRVRITGTTTITSLGTIAAGTSRTVTFTGALVLTHNATRLILPGNTNITTAAGDVAEFESLGSGNWRCTSYQKANGQSVIAPDVNQATARWVSAPLASGTALNDTSASAEFKNNGGAGDTNVAAIAFHCTGSTATKMHLRADGHIGIGGWSKAAWIWYLDPSNNMVAAGNVSAYSDPRLKENFTRIVNPLSILAKLDGGTFTWKQGIPHTEAKAGKRDYGVLADQVEAVMPEVVSQSIDIEGESYRVVSYEKLVPVLIEAVKELEARIKSLEGR